MLITLGFAILTTAVIVGNAAALTDVLESSLPAPVARAWAAGVVLAPGVGAALWLTSRASVRRVSEPSSYPAQGLGPAGT